MTKELIIEPGVLESVYAGSDGPEFDRAATQQATRSWLRASLCLNVAGVLDALPRDTFIARIL